MRFASGGLAVLTLQTPVFYVGQNVYICASSTLPDSRSCASILLTLPNHRNGHTYLASPEEPRLKISVAQASSDVFAALGTANDGATRAAAAENAANRAAKYAQETSSKLDQLFSRTLKQ